MAFHFAKLASSYVPANVIVCCVPFKLDGCQVSEKSTSTFMVKCRWSTLKSCRNEDVLRTAHVAKDAKFREGLAKGDCRLPEGEATTGMFHRLEMHVLGRLSTSHKVISGIWEYVVLHRAKDGFTKSQDVSDALNW